MKLAKTNPEQLQRMRILLGVDSGGSHTRARLPYVTLSLLQTLKHLDLPTSLKQQLMVYKVMSLNRQAEEAHATTMAYLEQSQRTGPSRPSKPAGLAHMLQKQRSRGVAPKAAAGQASSGG